MQNEKLGFSTGVSGITRRDVRRVTGVVVTGPDGGCPGHNVVVGSWGTCAINESGQEKG